MNLIDGCFWRIVWPYIFLVSLFVVVHWGLTIAANSMIANGMVSIAEVWIFNASAYSLFVMAGIGITILSHRSLISEGLLVGMLCAVLSILIFRVAQYDFFGSLVHLVNGSILGAIGSCIVRLLRRLRQGVGQP